MPPVKVPKGVGPRYPNVLVLFGATGDLSRRKLLPGLYHLANVGFIPDYRIVGVSLDDLDVEAFRKLARGALDEFHDRAVQEDEWQAFASRIDYVPQNAGPVALKLAVERAELSFGCESRRLHYLSVPPAPPSPP